MRRKISCLRMIVPKLFHDSEVVSLLTYSFITVLSLIGPGTSMGYSSIALPVLSKNNGTGIKLNETEIPLFASLPIISQIFGSLLSVATMKYGRRVAILTGSLVCTAGWIVIAFSHSIFLLFLGRILTGFSAGLCSSPGTVYLGEISTTKWRAVITSCSSLFISVGIVLVFLFGFLFRDNWEGVAAICILIPTVSAISTFFYLPESPTWLLTENRPEDAKKSLFRIRGLKEETQKFRDEFQDMMNYIEARKRGEEIEESSPHSLIFDLWRNLKHFLTVLTYPEVWKPFLILFCFFFFQQFSGLYVMMAYAVDVIVNTGVKIDPFLITVMIGVIQVVGGIINIFCSARIGRRMIGLISGLGMAVSLAILGLNRQFFDDVSVPVVPLLSVLAFVASGSFGFVVLPWAMMGELYPAEYVNILGPLTTCFAGIFNFAAVQLYPAMAVFGVATIYFYSIVATLATFFVGLVLPETLGKTRTEIEEGFRRRISIRS